MKLSIFSSTITKSTKWFFNTNDKFGNKEEFAIKLLTNQDDEIFLYTTNENKTFSEYYEILKQKEETYNGEKN